MHFVSAIDLPDSTPTTHTPFPVLYNKSSSWNNSITINIYIIFFSKVYWRPRYRATWVKHDSYLLCNNAVHQKTQTKIGKIDPSDSYNIWPGSSGNILFRVLYTACSPTLVRKSIKSLVVFSIWNVMYSFTLNINKYSLFTILVPTYLGQTTHFFVRPPHVMHS